MYECLPIHYPVCIVACHRVQRSNGRYSMSEVNKAIYRRAWQELMNQWNLAIVDELFAPNYVLHDPHVPLSGREALKHFTTALHQGLLRSPLHA